jgi:hypothetical protein
MDFFSCGGTAAENSGNEAVHMHGPVIVHEKIQPVDRILAIICNGQGVDGFPRTEVGGAEIIELGAEKREIVSFEFAKI